MRVYYSGPICIHWQSLEQSLKVYKVPFDCLDEEMRSSDIEIFIGNYMDQLLQTNSGCT